MMENAVDQHYHDYPALEADRPTASSPQLQNFISV